MALEDTPEHKLSMSMRPACDDVLCSVFGVDRASITRYDKHPELYLLDREFAIDLAIKLRNGARIIGQEKALSNKFHGYRTFTVEFWQDRNDNTPGEFFKIASQFYLHGYADADGRRFVEWKVIDIFKLMCWLRNVSGLARRVKPSGGSRSAFLPIPYDKLPKEFVFAEWRATAALSTDDWLEEYEKALA